MQKNLTLFLLIFVFLAIFSAGCDAFGPGKSENDYLTKLNNLADFASIEGEPLIGKYSQVRAVKVVVDLKNDNIYFVNGNKHSLHYDFCVNALGYKGSTLTFNAAQYGDSDSRQYALFDINYHTGSNWFVMEFWAGDLIKNEDILKAWQSVSENSWFIDLLRFIPSSEEMKERTLPLVDQINFIDEEELYAGLQFQPLNQAEAYGYLRKIEVNQLESSSVGREDIVLTNGIPNDLPAVSGIITTAFQSPLSHINILSRNRGTPNMALRNGWENATLDGFIDELIHLEVMQDTFSIRTANLQEAQAFWDAQKPTETIILEANLDVSGLQAIDDLRYSDSDIVGSKAANFAEIDKISVDGFGAVPMPEAGFAIPFYYYEQHLVENGLDIQIRNMLADQEFQADISVRRRKLDELRDAIKDAPIDADFLALVENQVRAGGFGRMRFRSSTNAEDLPGFNGAGLYSSKTGILDDNKKTIEKAIKKVWASVWNDRAFEERSWFGIDHESVKMGILAHRSFPDELANGVAITKNIYNPRYWGITVTVQEGEVSVVSPPAGVVADEYIYYTYSVNGRNIFDDPLIEFVTRSSLTNGETVLSSEESALLSRYLLAMKRHIYDSAGGRQWESSYTNFALDVEFKFDEPDRKLYIKQARFY